jgi:probable rRNA maturation factor
MLEIFDETESIDLSQLEDVQSLIPGIFKEYKFEVQYLNIIFLSDEELIDINKEFLEHDYYTDIITFNYSDKPQNIEGELYISVDGVKENGSNEGVDFMTELKRVIIHGVLHLVGYKDDTNETKKEMQTFENKYLNLLRFT